MRSTRAVTPFVCFLVLAACALGQANTGTLLGNITDQRDVAIPQARLALTEMATGAVRDITTDSAGLFQFVNIRPGKYSLAATAKDFKTYELRDIEISAAEVRNLGNLILQLGPVDDQITVTAAATPVQTSSSERSAWIEGARLDLLALKGRDPFGYVGLAPGVVDLVPSRDLASASSMAGIVINGAFSTAKGVTLDGVPEIDAGGLNSTYVTPNIDAIAEVRILSSGYQAEFGRQSGGSINIVTKSGTRDFHGAGHWDHRHEDLNANNFFNNRSGIQRPLYRYLIAGYSVGGPLYIPKRHNTDRNKLFFFLSQEFTQVTVPTTSMAVNEPTLLERSGDFSQTKNSLGDMITIKDPTTGQKFPENVIPASRIDPIGSAILNLFPTSTEYLNRAPGQQYLANSLFSGNGFHQRQDTIVRFDAAATQKLTAYFRFAADTDNTGSVQTVTAGVGDRVNFFPGQNTAIHAVYAASPTLVNEFLAGYGHDNFGFLHPDGDSAYYRTAALNPPTLRPFPQAQTGECGPGGSCNLYPPYLPSMAFSGGSAVGTVQYQPWGAGFFTPWTNFNHNFVVQNDLTKVLSKHRLKAGIYTEYVYESAPLAGLNYAGSFNFGSATNNPLDTGHGYANALLGIYQTYTESTNRAMPDLSFWQIEGYIQDSYRVTKRLTLDIGVRLIHQTATRDDAASSAAFYPQFYRASDAVRLYQPGCKTAGTTCSAANQIAVNPLTGATTLPALVGTVVPGTGNLVNGIRVNGLNGDGVFYRYPALAPAPRFGFAWDVLGNGKMAIRGSAGLFYNRGGLGIPGSGAAPVVFTPQLLYGYINQIPQAAAAAANSPVTGSAAEFSQPLEVAYQINLTVQRDIGFHTVVDVGYVGNLDRHASQNIQLNPVPFRAYAVAANIFSNTEINNNLVRAAYPGMGAISLSTNSLSALNYHALQASVQHRLTHGLLFGASYTFSKALGTNGSDSYHLGVPITGLDGVSIALQNQRNWFYGPLAQDRSQSFSLNYSFQLPQILRSWTFSGITSFMTGAPLTPSCSSTAGYPLNDPSLSAATARCNAIADPKNFDQDFFHNFNTAAFVLAPTGTFGNSSQGILRQPSWTNFDVSMDKKISLGERSELHIRWQAFNVLNHTEFNSIGATYLFNMAGANTNTSTGQYTGANQPRQMALTARFQF